jgi:hypothetical protein
MLQDYLTYTLVIAVSLYVLYKFVLIFVASPKKSGCSGCSSCEMRSELIRMSAQKKRKSIARPA